MHFLLFLAFVLLIWAAIFILTTYWLWDTGNKNRHATFLPESTIAFVMAGGTIIKTLVNIKGHTLDETSEEQTYRKIVKEQSLKPQENENLREWWKRVGPGENEKLSHWWRRINPIRKWLQKRFGYFWVSLLYPVRKLHRFEIAKSRLKKESQVGKDTRIRDLVEYDEKDTEVYFLRWRFPRYYVIEVIFKDGIRGTILVYTNWEVVYPYIPVFVYEGKFFDLLESAVRGKILDWANNMTAKKFIVANKGPGTDVAKDLLGINKHAAYEQDGEKKEAKQGTIHEFGIELIDGYLREIAIHEDDEDAQTALKAEEIAKLNGEAIVVTAQKNAEATRLAGDAEAYVIKATGEAERDSINLRYAAGAEHGGRTGVQGVATEASTRNLANAPNLRTLAVNTGGTIANIPLVEGTDDDDIKDNNKKGGSGKGESKKR